MRVTFAHPHGDHKPGDTAEVPDAMGRQLIHDGLARGGDGDKSKAVPFPGSTEEVLAAVDGDPAKARLALDAELARSRPRKDLSAQLEQLAGDTKENPA